MNSKVRILMTLEHKKPDRVPVTNRFTPEIAEKLADILGISFTDS